MGNLILILVFLVSIGIVAVILYWQWRKVKSGEVVIESIHLKENEIDPPITMRDIGILILYIIKHIVQFCIVQLSKIYFFLKKKIENFKEHKNPRVAKVMNKLKIPPVPPQAKAFIRKTVEETKQKINKVRQDLAELEDSIDKRVD